MPIRSLGRASMKLRVTSRIASIRVAACPPILKSFVNIEAETSSASTISMPLASTCVRLFPHCGRARPTAKQAMLISTSARRKLPARAALVLPSARNVAVDENVRAAAGPLLPRSHASSGIATSRRRNHGCAKVSAELGVNQSGRCKLRSFHKLHGLFQEHSAVVERGVVTRELDQIAA